ncbi:hypothetical protein QAD02_011521, partial [Eretmocerus hayati]
MESPEESVDKESAVEEQENATPNNVPQASPAKKKFRNTVFASKMRQKRKEERLKKLVASGNLGDLCKQLSVDVTRLAPDAVPKTTPKADHKVKKKKKPAWASGVIVKKKWKKADPEASKNKPSSPKKTKQVSGSVEVCKELESDNCNDALDEESDSGEISGWSCRRTEPFVSKYITKEDRESNINRFLKEEASKSSTAVHTKEDQTDESVSHENTSKCEPLKNDEDQNNSEKIRLHEMKESVEKKNQTLEEESSKNPPETMSETKEKGNTNSISCRRTVPFIGRNPWKLSSSRCSKLIELDLSSEANAESDSEPTDEQSSVPVTPLNITKSPEKIDATEVSKSSASVTKSFTKVHPVAGKSVLQENDETPSTSLGKLAPELDSKDHSNEAVDNESGNDSTKKNNADLFTQPEEKTTAPVTGNEHLDSICNERVPSESCSIDNEETWSCKRTDIIEGDCRRTKPYIHPAPKVTDYDALSSIIDSVSGLDVLTPTVEARSESSYAHIFIQELKRRREKRIAAAREEELGDSTNTNSETSSQNGESTCRRKREKTPSDNELENDDSPVVQHLKKQKTYSSPNSKHSSFTVGSPTHSVSPKKIRCSSLSFNNDIQNHISHKEECRAPDIVTREVCIILTKLENSKDPLAIEFVKRSNRPSGPHDSSTVSDEEPQSSDLDDEDGQVTKEDSSKSKKSSPRKSPQLETNFHNVDVEDSIGTLDEVFEQMESVNSTRSGGGKNNSSSDWSKRRKSRVSRESSASPIIEPGRRRKPKVANYVDDSSDSDGLDTSAYLTDRFRVRTQTRNGSFGPTLRQRNKSVCYSNDDEDDLEVEAFSRRSRKRRILSSDEDEDCAEITTYMTRSRSRGPSVAIKERQSSESENDEASSEPPTVDSLTKEMEKFSSELDNALKS